MTDTLSLYRKCPHDLLEPHLLYQASHPSIPDVVCPGGAEVVLQRDSRALLPSANPGAVPRCEMIDLDVFWVEASEVNDD